MAGRRQAFQSNPELQQFLIPDARPTGKQLGVGSYGSVEELEMKGLVCAGKRLHDALLQRDNAGVANIERKYIEECQVMAKMRHPHIVQFLGLCFLEGSALPVLVMERLDSNLDDLLEGAPGLPLTLKRSLLADVARGLLYLHTHDPPVVHRDLSARNVLLTSSLVAKISDLGNAHIVNLQPGQLARTLTHLPGTMVYMPPEAFEEGSRYGPQLDIFSFGHLALFTLTQVFPGTLLPSTYADPQNPDNLLARSEVERRRDYIQPLHGQLGEEHPLVQLVHRCLHNTPARRPSAEELLQQLEAVRAQIEGPYGQSVRVTVDMEKVRALREKDTEIRRLQHQMEVEMEVKDTQLQQKDTQIQRQGTELRERTLQLNRQLREVQTLREDRGRLQAEVEAKLGQIQEKDAAIDRQQRELQALRIQKDEQLAAVQSQLQQLQAEIDARSAQVQQQLRERDAEINRLHTELRYQTVSRDESVAAIRSPSLKPQLVKISVRTATEEGEESPDPAKLVILNPQYPEPPTDVMVSQTDNPRAILVEWTPAPPLPTEGGTTITGYVVYINSQLCLQLAANETPKQRVCAQVLAEDLRHLKLVHHQEASLTVRTIAGQYESMNSDSVTISNEMLTFVLESGKAGGKMLPEEGEFESSHLSISSGEEREVFTPARRALEDHVTQNKDHVTQDEDHVTQNKDHVTQDEDHVTSGTAFLCDGESKTACPPHYYRALFMYDPFYHSPNEDGADAELPFCEEDIILARSEIDEDGFFEGELCGQVGLVPVNMVEEITSPEELSQVPKLLAAQAERRKELAPSTMNGGQTPTPSPDHTIVRHMRAINDYDPATDSPNTATDEELSFKEGDILTVYGKCGEDGYYEAELRGKRGVVPRNFLEKVLPDQGKERDEEGVEVFAADEDSMRQAENLFNVADSLKSNIPPNRTSSPKHKNIFSRGKTSHR